MKIFIKEYNNDGSKKLSFINFNLRHADVWKSGRCHFRDGVMNHRHIWYNFLKFMLTKIDTINK